MRTAKQILRHFLEVPDDIEMDEGDSVGGIPFEDILTAMEEYAAQFRQHDVSGNVGLTVIKSKKKKPEVAVCRHEWIEVDSGYNMDCRLCGKRAE